MFQSLIIRLDTSEQDSIKLLETMRRYNEACNYVADKAFSLKISNRPYSVRVPAGRSSIAQEPELKSNQQLAEDFGVSSSTIERVRTILDQGTPEQIQPLRNKNETGEGPGVRTD